MLIHCSDPHRFCNTMDISPSPSPYMVGVWPFNGGIRDKRPIFGAVSTSIDCGKYIEGRGSVGLKESGPRSKHSPAL